MREACDSSVLPSLRAVDCSCGFRGALVQNRRVLEVGKHQGDGEAGEEGEEVREEEPAVRAQAEEEDELHVQEESFQE